LDKMSVFFVDVCFLFIFENETMLLCEDDKLRRAASCEEPRVGMEEAMEAGMCVGDTTAARRGAGGLSRRGALKLARRRLKRRVLACLFAMSLPVVALLAAGWMAWLRGDVVIEVNIV